MLVHINCSIYVDICFDRLLCKCHPFRQPVRSSTHSHILALARTRSPVRSRVNMKMWPRFQFVFVFFPYCCCLLRSQLCVRASVFNHIQLIIETSVGLNGLCACLTYFKMYLQIKGHPNHRVRNADARAHINTHSSHIEVREKKNICGKQF